MEYFIPLFAPPEPVTEMTLELQERWDAFLDLLLPAVAEGKPGAVRLYETIIRLDDAAKAAAGRNHAPHSERMP